MAFRVGAPRPPQRPSPTPRRPFRPGRAFGGGGGVWGRALHRPLRQASPGKARPGGGGLFGASVVRALRRFRREGVENVRIYHGEGAFALRNLVPPRSVLEVIVNFPDPWPKKRHQENRLLQRGFFRKLSTRLVEGGRLLLTTDHEGYFRFALEEALSDGALPGGNPPAPAPPPHDQVRGEVEGRRPPLLPRGLHQRGRGPCPLAPPKEVPHGPRPSGRPLTGTPDPFPSPRASPWKGGWRCS
jgi:tRNA (guanine-N7-)-methyltransferase